jgi:hypothetical protein
MSIDQLLELSSHREALEQGAQDEKVEEPNRMAVASPITPPAGTTRPLTLEQVKAAYHRLTSEDRQRFRIWVGSGCPKTQGDRCRFPLCGRVSIRRPCERGVRLLG